MHATQQATPTNTLIAYGLFIITFLVYPTLCMFFSLNIYPSASPIIYHHLMTSQIHYSLEMLSDVQQVFTEVKVAWGVDSLPHHGLSCYVSKEACQWDLALFPPYSCCHCHFAQTKGFLLSKRPVPKATAVSGVNSNFILQLGQDSRIWTEVQYILLPNKRDYQKQGLKKKKERKRIFKVKKFQSHSQEYASES